MTVTVCGLCRDTTDHGTLCPRCARELTSQLRGVPDLLASLGWVKVRLSRLDPDTSRPRPPRPPDDLGRVPLAIASTPAAADLDALQAADLVRRTVFVWTLTLAQTLRSTARITDASAWLAERVHLVREHTWAADCARTVHRATSSGWALVDQPPQLWYAGQCDITMDDGQPCGRALYGSRESSTILCPTCGSRHDVLARREWLIAAAGNILLTAAECSRALSTSRHQLPPGTIRSWVHRGKLRPVDCDERGRPMYRLADVRECQLADQYGAPMALGRTAR